MYVLPELLEKESIFVTDFPLSRVLLKNDVRFLWFILVPRKPNVREFIDLSLEEQKILLEEINKVSKLLQTVAQPDKLNIGMIGNIVPDLHVHIVARHKSDMLWPKPVWGNGETILYSPKELEKKLKQIQAYLT